MKKKLIIKQVDESDCGVCSLLSIIRFYKGNVPLEILKINTNTNKFGTNAYEIIKCANLYGLEGNGLKINNIETLEFPVIAHLKLQNDFYHFVVIYKIKDNILEIMDPAKGKVKIPLDEFKSLFTGNIIELRPFTEVPYLKNDTSLKEIIIKFIKNNKKQVIYYYLTVLLLLCVSFVFSFIFKLLFENINLKLISSIFLTLLLLKILLTYIKNYIESHLENLLSMSLSNNFFDHLLTLPLKYIQMKSSGEILARFRELNILSEFISNVLFKNVVEIFSVVIIFILLLFLKPFASITMLVLLVLYIIIALKYNKHIAPTIIDDLNAEVDYTSELNQYINSIHSIHLLDSDNYFKTNFKDKLSTKYKNTKKLNNKINLGENLKDFIYFFIYLLMIYTLFFLNIKLVDIITYINIVVILLDNIKSLLNDLPLYTYQKNIFIKISEFFGIREEEGKLKSLSFTNNILFDNVRFSYDKKNQFLYNLEIKKGQHIMVKGQNGCGKSTFCQLLCGMINDYEGTITIDNQNLRDFSSEILKNLVNYSDQQVVLFKDTIINNITLGRNYNEELLKEICKICDIEPLVGKKRNRFNSLIYENCPNLSGGEIQKIILARTLLVSKEIIILDETLSEVSIPLEISIIKKLRTFFKDKTIIYITHKDLEQYFDTVIHLN